MQNLGVISVYSAAHAISGDGSTVVGYTGTSGGDHAFRWTIAGGMQDLGVLPGGSFSAGYAMSSDGAHVAGTSNVAGGQRAFRWTSSGGMQNLGIATGSSSSGALSISGDGSALAGWLSASGSSRAMFWTSAVGMVDLNSHLLSLGVDLTGWTLTRANGLSFDGGTITGEGIFDGQSRAWVVSGVPTPSSAAILAGALLLGCRRIRHRPSCVVPARLQSESYAAPR